MSFISSFLPTTSPTVQQPSSSSTAPRPDASAAADTATHAPFFGLSLFRFADKVSLPQHDTENAARRAAEVNAAQTRYVWSREVIGDTPMIEGAPYDEWPTITWVEGIAKTLFRILSNTIAVRLSDRKEELEAERRKLFARIGGILASTLAKITTGSFSKDAVADTADEVGALFGPLSDSRGDSLQEYKDMYRVFKPDRVASLDQFLRDDVFGMYRVAGPSPMHVRKLDGPVSARFPELTDDVLRGIPNFGNDSLAEMERNSRLFFLDYPEFDGVEAGAINGVKKEGFHIYAPTALFAIPKVDEPRHFVLPLAIRTGQGAKKYPVYTPNPAHTDPVTWIAAKTTVQVADGVMHETRYHLGRTHLLLECFIAAARRSLPDNHPLMKFLGVHFEGTLFINFLGSLRLASVGGTIDAITAPPIQTTTQLCADAIRGGFQFNSLMPPREFKERGVDDPKLKYPYRDDALLLWKALHTWVGAYVRAYYKSDGDVTGDHELAAWCTEITHKDKGCVLGFGDNEGGKVLTVDYLVDFVATLVHIGAVQHAALNFSQGKFMQYVPAMPLAGFAEAPTTAKPFASVDEFVQKMIPPIAVAQKQLNTAELLAGFQYTTLGEYGRDLAFAPDEVDEALAKFKEDLNEIGGIIQKRNTQERLAGLPVYDFLVPKNIPQSTNV